MHTPLSDGGDARRSPVGLLSVLGVVFLLAAAGFAAVQVGMIQPGTAALQGETAAQSTPDGTLAGATDLADANTTIRGADVNDTTGYAVANAGDVNGDGHLDLLVSAPDSSLGGDDSGAVYLFYGPVSASSVDVTDADVTFVGAPGDRAGTAVAGGDLDSDGYADVLVGAPSNDSATRNSGVVYLVRGDETLEGRGDLADSETVTPITGTTAGARAGQSVAVVETTDGTAALVGAPFATVTVDAQSGDGGATLRRVGAAYLFRDVPSDATNVTAANLTYAGGQGGDRAGWSVASAGDVDDDGQPEALVGSPRNDTVARNAGAAFVVETDGDGGTVRLGTTTALLGAAAGDRAGYSVSAANDVDGDGVDDVVVGAPFNDSGGTASGAAYIAYGRTDWRARTDLSAAGTLLAGEGPRELAGYDVAVVDSRGVSCDGRSDVLVGAPFADRPSENVGAAYLVYGQSTRPARTGLGDAGAILRGASQGDRAGWSVADGGDLTGDGRMDVLVGAPRNDTAGTDSGAAYVLAGVCQSESDSLEAVEVSRRCTDQGGEIQVTNPNDEAVRVTVDPAGFEDEVTVPAGETRVIDGLPDGDITVRTFSTEDGQQIGDAQQVSFACATEEVEVRTRCTDEGGELILTNPNEEAVQVYFTDIPKVPQLEGMSVTLEGGETRTLENLPNSDYHMEMYGFRPDGDTYFVEFIDVATIDCDLDLEPVEVSKRCTDDGGEITVKNPNPVPVLVDGDRSVFLEGAETHTFDELPDGEYSFETFADGMGTGEPIGDPVTVTLDCDTLDLDLVEVSQRCTEDGGVVTIENPNDRKVGVTFERPDGSGSIQNIEPGESLRFEDLGDGEYSVQMTFRGRDIGDPQTGTLDCAAPDLETVEVSQQCTADGGELRVTNPNDESVLVEVEGVDGYGREVTIDPGETHTFEDLGDGEYRVRTFTEDGERVGDATAVEVACPTEPASVTAACDDGEGALVVENPNAEAVAVDVDGPRNVEKRVTVEGGATERIGPLGNGGYHVRTFAAVDGNGYQIGDRQVVTINCVPGRGHDEGRGNGNGADLRGNEVRAERSTDGRMF